MLIGLVYLFVLSITLLGDAFKLAGKDTAKHILELTSSPYIGLVIGILATSLIQSSSTTTSLVVGMVGTGILTFENAVPIVMGANIGTTVTNTIVSLAHIRNGDEFKRAFAGSTVHDFYNLCSVAVLFPLQVSFDIIGRSAHFIERLFEGFGGLKFSSPLKAVTKPVSHWIIDGGEAILSWFGSESFVESFLPWFCAALSIIMLFIALRYIVKTMKSLVLAKVERFFQRYIFRTPALGFVLGILFTVAVQSSSITTSLVVPLLGAGVITLAQIYPYVLGANIGTTITAFLASFVTGSAEAVSVAFAHLFFNLYGTAIFWPLKAIPIALANKLSEYTQKSKLVPVFYILIVFFAIPAVVIWIVE